MDLGVERGVKPRILIVDDLPFMRSVLKDILVDGGFDLIGEAVNGKDGVLKYVKLKPDAVLLDIAMPVLDGISALKKIMRLNPGARVIMCSAMGEQEMIIKAIQNGARDFIVKPFSEERVVSALKAALNAG